MTDKNSNSASFRDPSGFIFTRDSKIYRQVNSIYKEHYDHLMNSGLYDTLASSGMLVMHEEVGHEYAISDEAYKILKPDIVPFISYPYEWSFSQLKDAALLTLNLQKTAMKYDMSLKDASAYNVQFIDCRPVFIDTISFEKYKEGSPWVAYRQFCQHFLAPLVLMSYTDIGLNQLLRTNIDGIPLYLASKLLPFKTWVRFSTLMHLHLHARSQKRYASKTDTDKTSKMSRSALLNIINSLESAIKYLNWQPGGTEWAEYYDITNYSSDSFQIKKQIVSEFLLEADPKTVWDLGANLGLFSRIASEQGRLTISFDIDPAAVEKNYIHGCEKEDRNILPLILDLTNPSPGIGWAHEERMSLSERGPADMVMSLALIHHLAISNNLPLGNIAEFFSRLGDWLIIEFVPKSDSQVKKLLATREDIFPNYRRNEFESTFKIFYEIKQTRPIEGSERYLYLMKTKEIK
jgi:ribosomal protein L11 methylase PrmA